MSRTTTWTALLLAGLLAFPPAALAMPQPPPGSRAEEREDIQETIEIYMVAKLKRFLELSDAQERQVIPLVEELNGARREANRKRRTAMVRLRLLVEEGASGDVDDAAVSRQIEELERLETDVRETERRVRDQLRAQLTPLQQARFIVFQERFRQEIQDRLRRMDQDLPQGPKRPMGGPPGPRRPR